MDPCTTKSDEQFESLSRDSTAAAGTSEVFHAHGPTSALRVFDPRRRWHCTCTLRDEQYANMQPVQQVYCGAIQLHWSGSKADKLVSANADTLKT